MAVAAEHPWESVRSRGREVIRSGYSLVLLIIAWEAAAQVGFIPYNFLPPLSDILRLFWELTISGDMLYHTRLTLQNALAGLAIAVVLAVPLGVLAGRNSLFEWFWSPVIAVMYPVPAITLIPIFRLWFGVGDQSKILLVAWACFWPIILNARDAARDIDEYLLWSARMMGTSERALTWRVVFPGAAPGILTGIQIALPVAFIAAFIFEMVAGPGGLGYLQIQGHRRFRAPQVFAAIIAIMIVGLASDRLLRYVRRWVLRWE